MNESGVMSYFNLIFLGTFFKFWNCVNSINIKKQVVVWFMFKIN